MPKILGVVGTALLVEPCVSVDGAGAVGCGLIVLAGASGRGNSVADCGLGSVGEAVSLLASEGVKLNVVVRMFEALA